MIKQVVVLSLLFLAFCSAEEPSIENGQKLLTQLVLDAEKNLEDVKTFWADSEPLYKRSVEVAKSSADGVRTICQGLNADVQKTEQGIENVKHYIEWIGSRIKENIERVDKLESARCDASKTYVNGLKNDKIMLKLIAFLRKAIEEKDSLNLAQIQGINDKIKMFVQLFNENHFIKYLQLDSDFNSVVQIQKRQDGDHVDESKYDVKTDTSEKARTTDEIGTKHVDEKRDQIVVKDFEEGSRKEWPQYKQEILKLLDDLQSAIETKMAKSQNDEVAAGISLAEFKIQVERENKGLDKALGKQAEEQTKLETLLVKQKGHAADCQNELSANEKQVQSAEEQYQLKQNQFNEKKDSILSEIETFKYVLTLYKKNLAGEEDQSNRKFDSTYDRRELDNFDFIKSRN